MAKRKMLLVQADKEIRQFIDNMDSETIVAVYANIFTAVDSATLCKGGDLINVEYSTDEIGEVESCGSCGCFHPFGFEGDCRDDSNRFPDLETAAKAMGVFSVKERCSACEGEIGPFLCGVPGVLARIERGKIVGHVERCDTCNRFKSDDEAAGELNCVFHPD